MLNVIKYDYRKISTLFYSLFVANIILHLGILLLDSKYGWWDDFVVLGAISITSTIIQVLHIVIIYNYNATLKSITRRLLPISAVKEYISQLIVPLMLSLAFIIEGVLFIVILKPEFKLDEINALVGQFVISEMFIGGLLSVLVYTIMTYMFYFFAVAITRLCRTNAKIIIFIGILFVGSVSYQLLHEFINFNSNSFQQNFIYIDSDIDGSLTINLFKLSWGTLIDLVVMGIMSFTTVYIVKNKLEV